MTPASMRVLVALAAALLFLPAHAQAHHALPLGSPTLHETRTAEALAPGVRYTKIVRGSLSKRDGWTADVAVVRTRAEAQDLARRLRAVGFDAEVETLERPPDDRAAGPLGRRVHSGLFATKAEADERVAAIRAAGFTARGSVFTAEDGTRTSGPWVVHVLSVDPWAYSGQIAPVLANDLVVDRETLSSMTGRTGALAGVNGGYFVIGAADGTPGDLAGSSILDGRLISEAVDGRTDLLLRRNTPAVAALSDDQSVRASDGATRLLDGDNRRPGLIRACGGSGGDLPTERPLHDVSCTDPSELIRSTPIFGAATEAGEGVEALLDGTGRVTALREPRGGPIPPGGSVLAGTGDAADWLRAHAPVGSRIDVTTTLRTERGPFAASPGLGVVNGGPRLLRGAARRSPPRRKASTTPTTPASTTRSGSAAIPARSPG